MLANLGGYMTSRVSLRVAILSFTFMLFAAVVVKASHVDNARLSQSAVVAVAPSGMAAMSSANILFQFDDDRHRVRKQHVVTPEPATWLYILGAALLVLIWERKTLRSHFSN